MNLIKRTIAETVAASIIVLAGTSAAQAATIIGNDPVNRSVADGWSHFVLSLTTKTFSQAGLVTDWKVYANNSGNLGMLLLRNAGGNNYKVIGADFENVSPGLNSFSFSPDTGIANVLAGDILGLFIGTAKVKFDYLTNGDNVAWCYSSNCITNINTQLAAGQILALRYSGYRIYSANVTLTPTASVPEPSTILGLITAVAFGAKFKRKVREKKQK